MCEISRFLGLDMRKKSLKKFIVNDYGIVLLCNELRFYLVDF